MDAHTHTHARIAGPTETLSSRREQTTRQEACYSSKWANTGLFEELVAGRAECRVQSAECRRARTDGMRADQNSKCDGMAVLFE